MDKPWRDQGLPWPLCRILTPFCLQRKVAGLPAKPLHEKLLAIILMQKKCINIIVSCNIKENGLLITLAVDNPSHRCCDQYEKETCQSMAKEQC